MTSSVAEPVAFWLYAAYLGLFSVGILAGLAGNTLIIGTILHSPKLRKNPTFAMMLNLSVSDFLVSVTTGTFTFIGILAGKAFFDRSPFWCEFAGSVCVVSCGASLISMGLLAVNRYFCIFYPKLYKRTFAHRRTLGYCALSWICGIAFNVPNYIPGWSEFKFDAKAHTCSLNRKRKAYVIVFCLFGIVLPCLAMGFSYVRIFVHSYGVQQRSRTKTDSMRLVKALFASFFLYAACWIPAAIILPLDTDDRFPTELHMFIFVLAHLNSAMNPIFYAIFNPRIEESYKHFLNLVSCGILFANTAKTRSHSYSWTPA